MEDIDKRESDSPNSKAIIYEYNSLDKLERKDYFGNSIDKKSNKKGKVSFADQVGNNELATIYIVESYKKYNILDEED